MAKKYGAAGWESGQGWEESDWRSAQNPGIPYTGWRKKILQTDSTVANVSPFDFVHEFESNRGLFCAFLPRAKSPSIPSPFPMDPIDLTTDAQFNHSTWIGTGKTFSNSLPQAVYDRKGEVLKNPRDGDIISEAQLLQDLVCRAEETDDMVTLQLAEAAVLVTTDDFMRMFVTSI